MIERLSTIPPWGRGPDAARILRNALSDRAADLEERVVAAELAGDLVVMDGDEELAEAAYEALVMSGAVSDDDLDGSEES